MQFYQKLLNLIKKIPKNTIPFENIKLSIKITFFIYYYSRNSESFE